MTLSFKTHIDGKPNYFVEKIWGCFILVEDTLQNGFNDRENWFDKCVDFLKLDPLKLGVVGVKIHTIRADPKNRWRVSMPIHFVVNNRTPKRFQFAPTIPVKAIQEIYIRWSGVVVYVSIDGKHFYDNGTNQPEIFEHRMLFLAKNDGFDSVEDFFKYFNTNFKGKIIHWTDFMYKF